VEASSIGGVEAGLANEGHDALETMPAGTRFALGGVNGRPSLAVSIRN